MVMIRGSKWDAAEAMLKLIIKDKKLFCYNCGDEYNKKMFPCCSDPLIDTWAGHLRKLMNEINEHNKMNINKFGSDKKRNIRACLSLPPALLIQWSKIFKKQYGEELLRTHDKKLYKQDVRNMMKRIPMFRRCEVI